MKFCYIDESGTGDEKVAVMVGIVVDSQRMHVTISYWSGLLSSLSSTIGKPVREFHTRDFYAGNSPWRGVDGTSRAAVLSGIFSWLEQRQHRIVYSAVDKAKYFAVANTHPWIMEIGSLWSFLALHVTLSLQRHMQSTEKTKGHTVLVFDNEEKDAKRICTILHEPPAWTETYYSRSATSDPLSHIIDVPYFADSRHVGLIQVADVLSYFIRRYIELSDGHSTPAYHDEVSRVRGWVTTALNRSISKSAIYPSRGQCACSRLFYEVAPEALLRA